MGAQVISGFVFERSTVQLLARVENPDGSLVTQASLSAVNRQIHKIANGQATKISTEVPETIADVIFDTLQNPDSWSIDGTGYNFAAWLDYDDLPEAATYRVEYEFVTTGGERYWGAVFEITAHRVNFTDD